MRVGVAWFSSLQLPVVGGCNVAPGQGTDDGVSVGRAAAEADRMRSVEDDDRVQQLLM